MIVYLDMDGVIADFEAGLARLGFDPTINTNTSRMDAKGVARKRQVYDAIMGTNFFYELPVFHSAHFLYRVLEEKGHQIKFLTAAPKFGSSPADFHMNPYWQHAAYLKRKWLAEVFFANGMDRLQADDFYCTISELKRHWADEDSYLIDDRPENVNEWITAGGRAYRHIDMDETIAYVQANL